MAGIEAGLIFALRAGISKGTHWPVTLMAVLAALFLALGVLRHYLDIYLHRTVRGISFIFCGIDALGDLTSLLSLIFEPSIDVLGMVIYGVELALWSGIFACGAWYNLRPWLRVKFHKDLHHGPGTVASEGGPSVLGDPTSAGATSTLTLHSLPSSTSVFRTPSAELAAVRSRTVVHLEANQHLNDLTRITTTSHS